MRNRKGRPKKTKQRQPNGQPHRPPLRDAGTEQAGDRRKWLANGGDVTKAAYPLGVLLVNGAIGDDEHDAACRLAWLFASVHGRVSIAAARYEIGLGGGPGGREDEALADWEGELQNALAALKTVSRHTLDDMLNLVVYERYPDFMRPGFPTASDRAHAVRIRAGLRVLVTGWRRREKIENSGAGLQAA